MAGRITNKCLFIAEVFIFINFAVNRFYDKFPQSWESFSKDLNWIISIIGNISRAFLKSNNKINTKKSYFKSLFNFFFFETKKLSSLLAYIEGILWSRILALPLILSLWYQALGLFVRVESNYFKSLK